MSKLYVIFYTRNEFGLRFRIRLLGAQSEYTLTVAEPPGVDSRPILNLGPAKSQS